MGAIESSLGFSTLLLPANNPAHQRLLYGSISKFAHIMVHPPTHFYASQLFNDKEHSRKYQMSIGMLVRVVTTVRIYVAHNMRRLLHQDTQLTRGCDISTNCSEFSNRRIVIDYQGPIYRRGKDALNMEYTEELKDQYLEAHEKFNMNAPSLLVDEMDITVFVDSDHTHDQVMRKSVTGIIIFTRLTPVFYFSKQQGAISAYRLMG
jgi:hypothetical protein